MKAAKSLEETLIDTLPKVLPASPNDRIMGSKLSKLLISEDPSLKQWSENSIRQNLSALAGKPTSPIARYDQGFGYYLRPDSGSVPSAGAAEELDEEDVTGNRGGQPEEKFRALYMRYLSTELGLSAAKIEHTKTKHKTSGLNAWKFPDVVSIEWLVEHDDDSLDNSLMEVRQGLGEASFRVNSIELKVAASASDVRKSFFQCLSNSRWANNAILAIAAPIDDNRLANELRRLGTSYGIHVSTFGLSPDVIEKLPDAGEITEMTDAQFEKVTSKGFAETVLVVGQEQNQLDWAHVTDVSSQNKDFSDVFAWIGLCLKNRKAYEFERAMTIVANA